MSDTEDDYALKVVHVIHYYFTAGSPLGTVIFVCCGLVSWLASLWFRLGVVVALALSAVV